MDIKSLTMSQSKSKQRKARKFALPATVRDNEIIFKSRWNYGQLSTGTSGVLSASDISPSISNSSEYTPLQSIFTEVRLVSFKAMFGPSNQSGSATITVVLGTNLLANKAVHTSTPLAATDVQNLEKKRQFQASQGHPVIYEYKMPVPPRLDFTNITADAPSPQQPWAGSPGCIYVYAAHGTVSSGYLDVWCEARWHLRGRQ